VFSHAGDRSDQDMLELTNEVVKFEADEYIIAEVEVYLRGRELGEIPALVKKYLSNVGIYEDRITIKGSPLAGAKYALEKARMGDVVLLFTLSEREEVHLLLG